MCRIADFLKFRNHSFRLSKYHNQVHSILYKPSLSFEVRLDMLFVLSNGAICPLELYWSPRDALFLPAGPHSISLLVFSSSPVAPFSFLSKIDMGSPCCSAAVTINECVFFQHHLLLLCKELNKMWSDSSLNMHTSFKQQKCCFVLIWCPHLQKKNLLLDWQPPHTLNKRIKEKYSYCISLLEACRHNVGAPACHHILQSHWCFFTRRLGVRQTELIFQPRLNLHSTDDNISSFKAACPLGIPHIFRFPIQKDVL